MATELQLIRTAQANHHILTSAAVRAHGISWERWNRLQERGLWLQITPDHFRHVATPLTFDMQVRAGAQWLGQRGALFGMTALRWLGLNVPEPERAEFLVPRESRSIANWMIVHTSTSWTSRHIIWQDGVRTTTAARALVDLASTRPNARALEDAIDEAIRSRRTAMPQIRRELERTRQRGRPGVALMSELLLDSGGESRLERRFLALVRHHKLPRPRCQVVHRSSGRFVARVDFAFDHVVVEVSGRLGHVSDRERQKDSRRRNALIQDGFEVIEFTTADVISDPDYVLRTLARSGIVAA